MSNKPEEGWLVALWDSGAFEREDAEFADAELRRLHEVNQELLEACERLMSWDFFSKGVGMVKEDADFARTAIAKATGE